MIMVIYCRRPLSTHIHVFLMGKSVKKTVPRFSWSGVTVSDAALLNQFLVMTLRSLALQSQDCSVLQTWAGSTTPAADTLQPSCHHAESVWNQTQQRSLFLGFWLPRILVGILWIIWVCLGFNLVFISSAFQLHKIIIIITIGSSCFHLKFLAHARKGRLRAWIMFLFWKTLTLKFPKVILLALFTLLRDIGCSLKFINSLKSDSVFCAGPDLCTMCELLLLEFIIGCVRH